MADEPKTIADMTDAERADLQRSIELIESRVDTKLLARIDKLFVNSTTPEVLATLAKINAKAIAMAAFGEAVTIEQIARVYMDYSIVVASHMVLAAATSDRKDN